MLRRSPRLSRPQVAHLPHPPPPTVHSVPLRRSKAGVRCPIFAAGAWLAGVQR